MNCFKFISKALATSLVLTSCVAFAQTAEKNVEVKDAWIRSTVAGQQASGAFMKITARQGTQLVDVSSPAAGVAEVHEMKVENDVMKMRAVPLLSLPPGKVVELKPGGYHVMLMDLNQAFVVGSTVPLTLHFQNAKGLKSRLDLMVPVRATPPGAGSEKADLADKLKAH